jgi:hypothetical protein
MNEDELRVKRPIEELPNPGVLWLAQHGNAFEFLSEDEDLYSEEDLKVTYR